MKYLTLAKVMIAGLTSLSLTLPSLAENALVTDVGTLDKATAETVFPAKRPYSPWAGRDLTSTSTRRFRLTLAPSEQG